ncbi:ALF repeat-containing protein [Streptomyces sp. NPDC051771]|uniref:ALF repeat-containing protein n=1 Tax=Streptomyces sp. NPDC051771 TaxID=3154847 RepID=UPI0034141FC7
MTATEAVTKAQEIYLLARAVEAEELLGRTNAGIALARDQQAEYTARAAKAVQLQQAVKDRDAERARLVTRLAEPGADVAALATEGRRLALLAAQKGTAWGRGAAETALAGPDEVVVEYLRNGWTTAREQDERSYVARLAEESESPEVRAAAETALTGDAAAVTAFVDDGQYQAAAQNMRVAVAQAASTGGPVLADAAKAVLNSGDPKKYSRFLSTDQITARTQDERVRAAQLFSVGGPEVRSAARVALEGSPQTVHAFIVSGQYKAARQDHLNATHVAQVQKLIADAAKIAAVAQKDAATAQKVAATARKAAAEANDWALKAEAAAKDAQASAAKAAQYATQAEASAASAAASAATARKAAEEADLAARDAALSASDATLSSELAQASAASAWTASEQARQASIAAGQDADAALAAAQETLVIAVRKYREEEEARRKAALEAKQKAMEDPGARAREIYRCGQAFVPCDPQGFARWCQHNEIGCDIVSMGPEFNQAMEELYEFGSTITGLGELEECLEKKDFASCGTLAVDVLVGAKLKALNRAWESLTLLRRGCRIIGAATMGGPAGMTPMMGVQAAAGPVGKGCLEGRKLYDVYREDGTRITDIDVFEGDVLWEDKGGFIYWDDPDWYKEHLRGKIEKYIEARTQLPEFYRDAPMGFWFTAPQDPRTVEAVEKYLQLMRAEFPQIAIQTRWS